MEVTMWPMIAIVVAGFAASVYLARNPVRDSVWTLAYLGVATVIFLGHAIVTWESDSPYGSLLFATLSAGLLIRGVRRRSASSEQVSAGG